MKPLRGYGRGVGVPIELRVVWRDLADREGWADFYVKNRSSNGLRINELAMSWCAGQVECDGSMPRPGYTVDRNRLPGVKGGGTSTELTRLVTREIWCQPF